MSLGFGVQVGLTDLGPSLPSLCLGHGLVQARDILVRRRRVANPTTPTHHRGLKRLPPGRTRWTSTTPTFPTTSLPPSSSAPAPPLTTALPTGASLGPPPPCRT